MDEKVCLLKHEQIDERLDSHDLTLKEHTDKISTLEKSDAVHTERLESLCKKLNDQTNAIWALVLAVFGALITYFFSGR
jgi:DNA-binding Xre family transcriptional regulator